MTAQNDYQMTDYEEDNEYIRYAKMIVNQYNVWVQAYNDAVLVKDYVTESAMACMMNGLANHMMNHSNEAVKNYFSSFIINS